MEINETLIGQIVVHSRFGEGKITEVENNYLHINFNGENKTLASSAITNGFLKFSDSDLQKIADIEIEEKERKLQEEKEMKEKEAPKPKIIGWWKPNEPRGYFGNWYPAPFTMDGHNFSNSEQAFMYKKAILFGDSVAAEKILNTTSPMICKRLGRSVKPFDSEIFDKHKFQFMVDVCYEKFSQNPELKKHLLDTGNSLLVEASKLDRIWGIGMTVNDPDFHDPSKWKGQNLLGKALMDVREKLKQ